MSAIPLGLVNKTLLNIESNIIKPLNERPILCMSRHRVRYDSPQWNDRKIADKLCKENWSDFIKYYTIEINHTEFIHELSNSKFCLCIHGGGYDPCPRFFECILYGTIPIIQHSPLDDVFSKFPVVFIDELNESSISREFLLNKLEILKEFYEGNKRKEILKLLTLDYWWNTIIAKLNIKCNNPKCLYKIHTNPFNNGGTHCCWACKYHGNHGPLCEKKIYINNSIVIQDNHGSYSENNSIVIEPLYGLCNKLRVIFSYSKFAREQNKTLIVIWQVSHDCPGKFLDYFEGIEGVIFKDNNSENMVINYKTCHAKFSNIDYSELKLRSFINDKIQNRIKVLGPNYIAVHIRRTDHIALAKLHNTYTSDNEFFDFIDTYKHTNNLYIATDNKETYNEFTSK
jgi:hypothetical protein